MLVLGLVVVEPVVVGFVAVLVLVVSSAVDLRLTTVAVVSEAFDAVVAVGFALLTVMSLVVAAVGSGVVAAGILDTETFLARTVDRAAVVAVSAAVPAAAMSPVATGAIDAAAIVVVSVLAGVVPLAATSGFDVRSARAGVAAASDEKGEVGLLCMWSQTGLAIAAETAPSMSRSMQRPPTRRLLIRPDGVPPAVSSPVVSGAIAPWTVISGATIGAAVGDVRGGDVTGVGKGTTGCLCACLRSQSRLNDAATPRLKTSRARQRMPRRVFASFTFGCLLC